MTDRAVSLTAMLELTRRPEGLPLLLLLRGVVTEECIDPFPGKFTASAVLVREDVSPERWQAIVTLIRKRFRYAEFPIYEKVKGRWRYVR